LLGAWAIANTTDYAAYNSSSGVGVVGQGGFVGYSQAFGSGNITNLMTTGTSFLTVAGTNTLAAGTTTTAMLRIGGAFQNDLAFATANGVLNLELGGLLRSNDAQVTTIGTTALPGTLTVGGTATSGTRELVAYVANAGGTLTINSLIRDLNQVTGTGSAALALVKSGGGTLTLSATNTYTGGTTVSQGLLNLAGTAGTVVIPAGSLTITGATVTMLTNEGQISLNTALTINNGGVLNLVGTNTLTSIAFNNFGSNATPTVATGAGSLVLTSLNPFTVVNQDASVVPTVSGTVVLAAGTNTISVGSIQIGGRTYTETVSALTLSAILAGTGASLVKTGNGLLQLGGANAFGGAVRVSGGGLVIANNSSATSMFAAGNGSTPLVSGPVGTGTLTMADGTRLLVENNQNRTIANPTVFEGTTLVFDKLIGANNSSITVNGSITPTLNAGALTLSVISPYMTANLMGPLTNASSVTSVTKEGLGSMGINLTGIGANVPIVSTPRCRP
jgi:autotransporter-associated beta strand protein